MGLIRIARVRDPDDGGAEPRFLVDRLWPRGVRKDGLRLTGWLPEVAPSADLRRWFCHEPERWQEFRRRYLAELEDHPEHWRVLDDAGAAGEVTLLYDARDTEHNNAVVLRDLLQSRQPRR